jgi:uncharacterized membrane protein
MDLSDLTFPAGWAILGWIAALAVFVTVVRQAPWRALAGAEAVLVLPAAVFTLSLFWSLRGHVGDVFAFHLLGTGALALAFGAPLALTGGALVVAIMTVVRGSPWANAGLVWLVSVAVPVLVALAALRFTERRFAPNFFVYVFGGCFFGIALAYGAAGIAAALLTVGAAGQPADLVFGEYVPFLLDLAFGEAMLSGMALTLAVVYRPQWVTTFDDARYLEGR